MAEGSRRIRGQEHDGTKERRRRLTMTSHGWLEEKETIMRFYKYVYVSQGVS
jgi:hypothetical protein